MAKLTLPIQLIQATTQFTALPGDMLMVIEFPEGIFKCIGLHSTIKSLGSKRQAQPTPDIPSTDLALPPTELDILRVIRDAGSISGKSLTKRLGVNPQAMPVYNVLMRRLKRSGRVSQLYAPGARRGGTYSIANQQDLKL